MKHFCFIFLNQCALFTQATPKNNYKPKSRAGKMFSKLNGKVWVTKDDDTWVKLEADFADDFSVGGFLFKIRKGTRIEIESTLVNDAVWLPRRIHPLLVTCAPCGASHGHTPKRSIADMRNSYRT